MNLLQKNIGAYLHEQCMKYHQDIALRFQEKSYTFEEIDGYSDLIALALIREGYDRGDEVAICSLNSDVFVFYFLGCQKAGVIPVLMNTHYKAKELEKLLKQNPVQGIFYGQTCNEIDIEKEIEKISAEVLPVKLRQNSLEQHFTKLLALQEGSSDISAQDRGLLKKRQEDISPKDTALILFTSGTTMLSKGVMLSHVSILNNAIEIAECIQWTRKDRLCVAVPMYHCFGITASLLAMVCTGASMSLLRLPKTEEILRVIEKDHCTVLNGVPSMFLALYHKVFEKKDQLATITSGIVAGSSLSKAEYEKIHELLPKAKILQSYGQTESSPAITMCKEEDSWEVRATTAGKKLPRVELRIYDLQRKRVAKAFELGEIQTRGYHIMNGYQNMPLETQKAIQKEGWLCTGDLGYLDDEGNLHITGRLKEMIIRGGENISPREIEQLLMSSPEVKECKVIGVEGAVLQEEIAACIVEKEGSSICEKKLRAFLEEHLAHYKVPKYFILFQALPYNGSGKIMLNCLKEMVQAKLEQGYSSQEFNSVLEYQSK